ncbi:MAG: sugar ABC transporter permease [Lachnospiraceae bacterium]|jgi:multiple sugar transport system permease protein|nr:sugar ABC transporter permease [Lachnospiraceae bacterium]
MDRKRTDKFKHILVLPALLIFVVITIFPLIFNIVLSLCNWKLGGNIQFVGLDNYIYAFKNGTFWRTMLNTVIVTIVAVAVEYVVAMILAYNINKLIHGKKFIRIIMLLPMLMAPVVIGFMWKQMFNELYGPLNHLLSLIGISGIPWISQSGWSLVAVILVDIWEWTPFITLILLAGFQSLPKEPIESARVDGAGEGRIFFDLTFKMLLPSSIVAITLRAIETFKIFDTVYIVTAGGPGVSSMSASMYAYQVGLRNFSLGKAAALCVIMLIIVLGVFQIVTAFRKKSSKNYHKNDLILEEENFSVYNISKEAEEG